MTKQTTSWMVATILTLLAAVAAPAGGSVAEQIEALLRGYKPGENRCITPTPAATRTATRTRTKTPTATATRTNSPVPTRTATRIATRTSTRVPTSTASPSLTPTSTATNTLTPTRSDTATPSLTSTPFSSATATSTPIPTDTPTEAPTDTPTDTDTDTPTQTPTYTATETPTAAPSDTATATPADTATATQTATNTPSDTPTWTLTSTPTDTPTATPTSTSSLPPLALVKINPGGDAEEDAILPPDIRATGPPTEDCPSQGNGGCRLLNVVDGSIFSVNVFDASTSINQQRGDSSDLTFRWEIFFPPTLQSAPYASNGISGYLSPVLTIQSSSLPSLADTAAGTDQFWRAKLTVTSLQSPSLQTVVFFRFLYQGTDLSFDMSTNCQRIGYIDGVDCTSVAANGLPTSEPH